MFYIDFALVIAVIVIIAVRYDRITNLQFFIIAALLLYLLFYYSQPESVTEGFSLFPDLKEVQLSEYQSKLGMLPSQLHDILMPKLIYIESAYKKDMSDKRRETTTLDENTYISNRDSYVCDIAADGTAAINKDKWDKMCEEYKSIDTVLSVVQSMNQDVWDKIVEFGSSS